jgi:hypothetical protein
MVAQFPRTHSDDIAVCGSRPASGRSFLRDLGTEHLDRPQRAAVLSPASVVRTHEVVMS